MNHLIVEVPSLPYAHRLYGYAGRCSRIHGHNARVTLVVEGSVLDAQGFVADFYDVKRRLMERLAVFDHTLVLARNDPAALVLDRAGEAFSVIDHPPTAEWFARDILRAMQSESIGQPWRVVSVRWEEEPGFAAEAVP